MAKSFVRSLLVVDSPEFSDETESIDVGSEAPSFNGNELLLLFMCPLLAEEWDDPDAIFDCAVCFGLGTQSDTTIWLVIFQGQSSVAVLKIESNQQSRGIAKRVDKNTETNNRLIRLNEHESAKRDPFSPICPYVIIRWANQSNKGDMLLHTHADKGVV